MSRLFVGMIAFFAGALCISQAQANVHVETYFTADNVTSAFYQDGAASQPIEIFGGNLSEWRTPKYASLDLPTLPTAHTYQLVFRVQNIEAENLLYGDPWNVGGFLAEIHVSGTGVTNPQILSKGGAGSGWKWALDTGDTSDFNSLTWTDATAWAYMPYGGGTSAKNGGYNVWGYINGGPVPYISTNAEWIWGSKNGVDLGTHTNPDPQNFLWIKTTITVQPVPEFSTFPMLSIAAVSGIVFAWRRRVKR